MKEKILRLLGLDKKSEYVKNFFFASNMKASIYMSVYISFQLRSAAFGGIGCAYLFDNVPEGQEV